MIQDKEFIFGIRAVEEAVASDKEIDRVLFSRKQDSQGFSDLLRKIRQNSIPMQFVPVEKLNRITRKNHQGVIAYISPVTYSPLAEVIASEFEKGKDPLLLILDGVSDVRNFGAIARSAECLGFSGIVIPERGAARINADAVKTSAGALLKIPVSRVSSLKTALREIRESGLKIIGISEKGKDILYDTPLKGPIALILGGEEKGISPSLLEDSSRVLQIPMKGATASLNVSVAASLAMYEVMRQRG